MALLTLLSQIWQEGQLQSSTSSFNIFLVPILFLSIFILFSLTRSSSPSEKNRKLKLPPSPPRLPWIGNLHQLGSFPHRSLRALSKKYGDVMFMHFGKVPTLIVSSAEMAKDVMKTHDIVFCSRPQTTAPSILFYDGHDIAFAPYGEYWRQVRRICVLELLSLKRVHQFQYARVEEVAELVSKIRKASASANGAPINLGELLVSTSNNIICRCILGQKFEDKEDNWFGETTKELMTQVMSFSFGDFFPSLKWIDRARGYLAYLKSIWLEFDKFFDKLIDEHKAAQKEGKPRKKDIVDILLDVQKDGSLDFELTTSNVKAILQDMFVGGSDTSWTAAIWLMSELSQNPRVMKKVQEEVRRVAGKRGYVEESDINEMKYLTCVIKENLRLHPPAPLLLPRETMSDVKLGGFDIPAKTQVFVNAHAVQRDPKVWDKPDEFMPERFEENNVGFVGQDFELIPFGAGRRVCPGLAFGVASAQYVLANMLYWFDWKLPSGGSKLAETLDMSEVYGLTVHKKSPLYLVPTPYSP
ncbi:cytochrome P450 71A1 [Prunus yedoensis var. nudiflora]|uniref:Cytochrome P450 71A1 n=1 Tax=Prunus yedoensis var. nudiflora TaxID=2094558 RepID=A0A314Y4K9_PRUYE|nr:cytochrome P450 71A1 [Prunus yedoensis var. nudiflora]